ncbi:MAG: hypothetical protein ISS74_07400 [Planctomycetes bacterium]|nr:hypothetical protein [Planctomycetota bacterium]
MTRKAIGSKDPDILASEAALRRAAKRALREGLETGTPVWAIKKGRMVDLTRGKRRKTRHR